MRAWLGKSACHSVYILWHKVEVRDQPCSGRMSLALSRSSLSVSWPLSFQVILLSQLFSHYRVLGKQTLITTSGLFSWVTGVELRSWDMDF